VRLEGITLEPPEKKTEASRGVEAKVIEASLREKYVVVSSSKSIEELASRGYGTAKNKKLVLTFCEALFLVSKGIVAVKDSKTRKKIDFQQLLSRYQASDENAWAKYLIYRDLRSRGYVAREGFGLGIDFRVYERGEYGTATAKNLVFGIQEGQPVSMEDLIRALKNAHSLKKELVLAVLNRRGEVVYYSLSKLTMSEK
jgi:tRNA-intron endonuclease